MSKKIFATLVLSLIFGSGITQAGLFGPSNYDECVLEGIKDAKTETAARMVAQACRNKFPEKVRPPEKSGLVNFPLYSQNGERSGLNNKLSVVRDKQIGQSTHIRLMNNYTFDIVSISVGVLKPNYRGKSCPSSFSEYREAIACSGFAGGLQSGNFSCDTTVNGSYCITKFIADFGNRSDKDIKELINKEVDLR